MESFLPFINREQCCKIWLKDILYIRQDGRITNIVTENETFCSYDRIKDMEKYLDNIELVVVGGESDRDARPLYYDWVLDIREQCVRKNVSFEFRQCGTHFIKDGVQYKLQTKDLCSQAKKAGIDFKGNKNGLSR